MAVTALILSHSAILTPDDCQRNTFENFSFDFTDKTVDESEGGLGQSPMDIAIEKIEAITSLIENHIKSNIVVDNFKIDIDARDWCFNLSLDKFEFRTRSLPIVEVLTDNVTISNDKTRLLTDDKKEEVEFFAGFRRFDQDLADLQVELPTLTVLPDVLPFDVKNVAIKLFQIELNEIRQNNMNTSSTTKVIGGITTELTRRNENALEQVLSQIDHLVRRV